MNDEERRFLGTSLSTSCRGSADAFARSLQKRFGSLNIANHDENPSSWYQNGHSRQVDQFVSSPLSPETEIDNPLSNGAIANHFINPELFLNTKPIEFSSCAFVSDNRGSDFSVGATGCASSPSDNFIDSSSVDDNYETASDLSADENDEAIDDSEIVSSEIESSASPSAVASDFRRSDEEEEAPEVSIEVCDTDGGRNDHSPSLSQDDTIASPKIRRCSSLKSGKTPPGTPGGKKIVRFADALGLDLADVKTYVDEIPKIPTSAYNDLNNLEDDTEDSMLMRPCRNGQSKMALVPLFTQPGERFDFMEKIRRCNVCLESALVDDPVCCSIRGVVRVRNIDFHKTVQVRYSTDRWRNSANVQASYVDNSCDGFSDKFSFLIYANMLKCGDKLEFAVCFLAKGNEYWDNNNGANYVFECISTQTVSLAPLMPPPSWGSDNWGAAFY
ncbi:glycogen-binding subunit 76A [Harmonia axyridis]|uniref:glycogen-binding subunit 76A n=1 Tax=Harmonia axyridis TaxID=115357 RepID=UPI001E277837|nr:glycogen-binding subunit 76A [Harmonia axyridis]XP_045463661.1 glycogen-binding subunit 76A [Harmonia axyridis]XP_045463662.1 glycogen-binding subunit 76A [Harmonia axyridis]XP_045463663.1 glycogen-binding subunit 76A [Harmonia axyridis]